MARKRKVMTENEEIEPEVENEDFEKRLVYIGAGEFIAGIPARGMSYTEAERYGGARKLIKTGLYRPAD